MVPLPKGPASSKAHEGLTWVVVHGRGVIHTGHANSLVRLLATAGTVSGRESYYYMRYDDSPERDHIPHLFYAVFGNPGIEVVLHEEVEPVGKVFDAVVVLDSSMLLQKTSQRALVLDGAKKGATLVVNTSLSPEQILGLVRKYSLDGEWEGKIVTVRAKDYGRDIAYPLAGALAKATGIVSVADAVSALASLGLEGSAEALRKAYGDSKSVQVKVEGNPAGSASRLDAGGAGPRQAVRGMWWDRPLYTRYKEAASKARSYPERMAAMPRWEALAPGLIEFGPMAGEKNIGFKTSFSRYRRPSVSQEKCTDCKLCSIYCPDGAVDFQKISVDYDYCQGCGICAQVCPPKAIEMVSELKFSEGLDEEMVTTVAEALREYGY